MTKKGKLRGDITYEDDGDNVKIHGHCVFTGEEVCIAVPSEGFNRWLDGVAIQVAMPDVSPEKREFIISGISQMGWEDVFNH